MKEQKDKFNKEKTVTKGIEQILELRNLMAELNIQEGGSAAAWSKENQLEYTSLDFKHKRKKMKREKGLWAIVTWASMYILDSYK